VVSAGKRTFRRKDHTARVDPQPAAVELQIQSNVDFKSDPDEDLYNASRQGPAQTLTLTGHGHRAKVCPKGRGGADAITGLKLKGTTDRMS
jgi:hypothetical protein